MSLRAEVERRPYVALLTAAGVGCVLAGGLPLHAMSSLARRGLRLVFVAALFAANRVAREPSKPT